MKKTHLFWNEGQHSVGNALIDSQHQAIIDGVNQITEAVANVNHSEAVQRILEMIVLAREHFAVEEGLMTENGFPDLKDHAKEHLRLLQQLNSLISEYQRVPSQYRVHLIHAFLTDWAEHHILHQAEKELGEFLSAKGTSH